MANVFIQDSTMSAIGDAIRAKTGGTAKILPADMATEIAAIETGSDIQLIEGMEIPLDFSAGDQSLAAPDGQAVKSATIKKPTTLVPQNIANGVNIAGVVGTLESGSGGGGESSGGGGVVIAADFDINCGTASASTPAVQEFKVPYDATNISIWQTELKVRVRNSSYNYINEDYVRISPNMFGENDMTITDNGDGYKTLRISFPTVTALSGGVYYNFVQAYSSPSILCYTMPSLTLEDNILYAGAACKRVCHYKSGASRHLPVYMEGIDLRGSQVANLEWGDFAEMTETKKIWLSETMTNLSANVFYRNNNLEELHFTSATPPALYRDDVLTQLPTTCKIYVPAGSLSAYTSAQYYPSASTYTYIEE